MPIKFWRIPFHCYQSGGGSRFYRYFDDVTIFLGILHLSENLLLRLSHSVMWLRKNKKKKLYVEKNL